MPETSDPFAPANGLKARWRYCYELVVGREPGDAITYEEVEELLDCERPVAQAAMLDAKRHLEDDGQRTVRVVRRYGWIVMRSSEHLSEAERRRARSRRALRKAGSVLGATRREELSPLERQALDRELARQSAQEQVMGRRRTSFAELEAASQARELSTGRDAS